MIALIVAIAIIAVAMFTTLLLVFINDKHMQSRNTELLKRINDLGIEYDLSFSSQEVLKRYAIGLDGKHRKLLVVKLYNASSFDEHLIDLDEVLTCTLKTTYRSIKAGELKKRTIEAYVETIKLQLEFLDHRKPLEISFYEHIDHNESKVAILNRKAKSWQIILSKMQKHQFQKIA